MIVYAVIASILWAVYSISVKYVDLDSFTVWLITYGIIALFICVVFIVLYFYKKSQYLKAVFQVPIKKIALLSVSTIFSMAIGTLFYLYAVNHSKNVSPITAIAYTSPLFVVVLAYLFLHERLSLRVLLGIIVTMTGIIVIASDKQSNTL